MPDNFTMVSLIFNPLVSDFIYTILIDTVCVCVQALIFVGKTHRFVYDAHKAQCSECP